MKNIILFIPLFLFFSCKKDKVTPVQLNAAFEFQTLTGAPLSQSPTIPTHVEIVLKASLSNENASYIWDLGNGKTFNGPHLKAAFDNPGTYQIVLKTFSADKKEMQTTSKHIQVKERSLKTVKIEALSWKNSLSPELDVNQAQSLNVIFRIYKGSGSMGFPTFGNGNFKDVNLLFEKKIENVATSGTLPSITIDKSIDLPAYFSNRTYGYCVYALHDGKEYILLTNWASGAVSEYFEQSLDDNSSRTISAFLSFSGCRIKMEGAFSVQ